MSDLGKIPKTIEADDVDIDLGIAKILVPMISHRTESDWINIGMALYNCVYEPIFSIYETDGLEQQAMDIWINNASERGYDIESLAYMWSTFSQGNNYSLRSIGWFARKDSPESYKSWHKSWYGKSISISIEKSVREHVAFGESFFKFFWLNYCYSESVCVRTVSRWYKFSNHSWSEIGPTEMYRALDVFRREVELYGKSLYQKLIECNDSNQKDIINNKIKKVSIITENYGNSSWRRNIVEISKDKFIIHDFHKKIDTNKCLTGVHNGVIEVNDKRAFFREGRPEDYITKYSSVDYIDMDDNHLMAIEYMKYMNQIFPDSELVDTQLRFFSSLLYGVPYKYFYIWTGGGDNGKSTLVRLLNATLGDDYVVTVSPAFITRRRVSSSNPTPDIADMKGARLVVIQEPDEGESLQPGVIKEATGGDKIRARKLNDNGGPFLPSYQIVLQCNDIPEAEKQDAMKSRVRIVPFLAKWEDEDNMPPAEECLRRNIHKKDPDFMSNIGRYASACLYYMVKYFEKFRSNPVNKIPTIVKNHTDTYWNTVDKFYQYIHERLEWKYLDFVPGEPYFNPHDPFQVNPSRTIDNNVILSPRDTYYDYVNWLRDTGRFNQEDKNNTFPKIVANISKFLGQPTLDGWPGLQPRILQVNY
jgi:phage/plasmid-associated DNA primase